MNRFVSLVLAGLAGVACTAGAQAIHLSPGEQDGVQLLLLRPDLRGGGVDFPSFGAFLSGRITLSEHTRLLLEFPAANVMSSGTSDFGIGNPMLGIEVGAAGGSLLGQFGLRLPLAADANAAPLFGWLSDITTLESWGVDLASFTAQALFQEHPGGEFVVEGAIGPSALFPTGGGDAEVLLHYAFRAGYENGVVRAVAGYNGITVILESGTLAERTLDQFVATLRVRAGTLMPLAWIGLPLDESYSNTVGVVLGLGIEFPVGPAPAP